MRRSSVEIDLLPYTLPSSVELALRNGRISAAYHESFASLLQIWLQLFLNMNFADARLALCVFVEHGLI